MEKEQIEHCCGNCCWFKFENIDGDGMCMRNYHDEEKGCVNCGDGEKCRKFISNEEKREILKKLKQWMLALSEDNRSALARELRFALDYIKVYDAL